MTSLIDVRPGLQCVFENYFSYFSTKTYFMGTQNNRLMFKLMGKKINAILGAQTILIWPYGGCSFYLSHGNKFNIKFNNTGAQRLDLFII